MSGFAVQGYGGDDGDVDRHHHVSVLCPENLSVMETLDLPFEQQDTAQGGSCGSLLYFIGGFGRIVIWNSTTKQILLVLDPPAPLPGCYSEVTATGLGYDAKSQEYKLVRHCKQKVSRGRVEDSYFDLHSLKCGTSNKLKTPFADINPCVGGVYLMQTGCCYWEAFKDCLPDDPSCILSFDFASDMFDHFPLPDSLELSDLIELVDVCGCLGVVAHHFDAESFSLVVKVFVRKETVWYRMYALNFDEHVIRPVGLKDGRLLFLEAKESSWCSQLMTYDLETGTSTKLNIKAHRGSVFGISYAETADPYSIPVTMISPNKEKEEEEKKKKKKIKEKMHDQNRSHIPHSRTMHVKAYNSIEEVEHLPFKALNI